MTDMATLSSKLSQLDLKSESDIRLVLSSFSEPSASRSDLATSYASLARFLLPSSSASSPPDLHAKRSIRSILGGWLSETSFPELGRAFAALSALIQTDLQGFSDLLATDDLQAQIVDAADTLTITYKILDEAEYAPVKQYLAIFVAQASGFAATRALGRQLAGLNGGWLEQCGRKADERDVLRAAAVVAGIKLQVPDPQSAPGPQASASASTTAKPATFPQKDAIRLLKQLYHKACSGQDMELAFLVSEGLSLLSMKPSGRRDFAADEPFIRALIKQGSEHAYTAFSIATIFALLTAYHRPTSEDDRLKEKMRQYAHRAGGGPAEAANDEPEQDESDSEIDERNIRLIEWGIVTPTALSARSSSAVVRRLAASILDGLVSKRDGRGTVIQQGGARALVNIIRASADSLATPLPPQEDLLAVQVLARLLITANPILVLGPGQETLLDLVRPITLLVTAPTASLLQHFEGLMALTNVAGLSEQLEDRIAKESGLLTRIEEILLEAPAEPIPNEPTDGRTLCRRAATELLCNIISCETVFLRYSALDQEERIRTDGRLPPVVASRLQVLVVLCDVDDAATRQAALGGLAYLTNASTVCMHIFSDPKRLAIILDAVDTNGDDAEEGVQIRAAVILGNICAQASKRKQDCIMALRQLAQDGIGGAKAQAAEILTGLQQSPEQ